MTHQTCCEDCKNPFGGCAWELCKCHKQAEKECSCESFTPPDQHWPDCPTRTPPVPTESWEKAAARIALHAHKHSAHYARFSEIIYRGISHLLESERKEAEQRGRDMAVDYVNTNGVPNIERIDRNLLRKVLEAARTCKPASNPSKEV